MTSTHQETADETPPPPLNIFFRLAVFLGIIFVMTIFAFVAAIFGDPKSPIIRTVNQYGGQIILWEVVALLIVAVMAMMLDQWRNRKPRRTSTVQHTEEP